MPATVETEVTTAQIARVSHDWGRIAEEPVVVQYIKGTFYGFTSELGAYRIERKYNCRPKCEAFYSKTESSWCVRLETNL